MCTENSCPGLAVGRCLLGVVLLAWSAGCVTLTTVALPPRTSVERQLAGELEPLTDEQLLVASVRAEAQLASGSLADLQAAAVAARRRQLFNRDDVEEAKQQGCLGEALDAKLVSRACDATKDPAVAARLARLLAEENQDRAAVIEWAITADAALTPADRPEVARVYHRMLLEASRPGDPVQADDGSWTRR
jgi:uncharacterized protein YdbL (DUF1318 family)